MKLTVFRSIIATALAVCAGCVIEPVAARSQTPKSGVQELCETTEQLVCTDYPLRMGGRQCRPIKTTTCREVPTSSRIDELHKACDLLIRAYGEEEGRKRCQELIERQSEE